jgi:hypothetical protein
MAKKANYSASKRINDVIVALIRAGWEYLGRNKHSRVRSPDGKTTITVPFKMSDHRAELNWISQIRRQGVEVPA